MSKVNQIQNGIDDQFTTAISWGFTIISAIIKAGIGVVMGAIVGFLGLLYFCFFMGDGAVPTVWALLYFTIPGGMLAGGILGGALPLLFYANWK
ncbi:hypothetical protein [Gimesia maris]|uniref:hypothetical protein n=1 Tax=Gimesia maris TaxID=122 RepID=UPI00241EC819|nr:hypothetical protein [Gimesia maris]|tara:strand:- start:9554 stop:9835 length:282 start_codon:yes stop_codon:yes gene_type:complete